MGSQGQIFYTKEHEWVRITGKEAVIGISDYAQAALGDVTFVDLPKIGAMVQQSKSMMTIESVKAASDVYAPLSGRVTKINDALTASPELVNKSCQDEGWLCMIEVADARETKNLLDQDAYTRYCQSLH
jgi:glycine cleavage system H protein